MRIYWVLSVLLSVVLAVYKKNMMFTIMPGKTTCFLKKVARHKVIEIEYQVLAREGVRSNLSITMDVIAPHHRVRSHVVTSQRDLSGAHVLDAAIAGVYRFCFDNSYDFKNKKTILFNLIIRSKKKTMKKQLRGVGKKQQRMRLKRLENRNRQKVMSTWHRDKVEQEEILRPQRKGKKHTNSSARRMKNKKKKKIWGNIKPLKKAIIIPKKHKQSYTTETSELYLEDATQLLEEVTQKMRTTTHFENNVYFILETKTEPTESLTQLTTEKHIEEEKIAWTDKENLPQYDERENSKETMKKNIIKEFLLKQIAAYKAQTNKLKELRITPAVEENKAQTNKLKELWITPAVEENKAQTNKLKELRITSAVEEITNNYDENDEDEAILTIDEEITTELYNVTRATTKRFDWNNIDNLFTPAGYNLNIANNPETEKIDQYSSTESSPLIEREEGIDFKIGDYPSMDYSGGSNKTLDRDESIQGMWMPYGWDMVY